MTPDAHREWLDGMTPAMWDEMDREYRSWAGESERDAAVRDTNHVVELQSRKHLHIPSAFSRCDICGEFGVYNASVKPA